MKNLAAFLTLLFATANAFAQQNKDWEKLVATEKSFAAASDASGIKRAFLVFLADDGIVFAPNAVNGKERFGARPDDAPATLSWYPIFADVSSNGVLGYTTGRGEFRAKGKTDAQVFYSEFATVWRRQTDGNYRVVLDIGVSHDKPASDDRAVSYSLRTEKFSGENNPSAADFVNIFYDTATAKGLKKAYKTFAADDARFLREGKFPILGKQGAPVEAKKTKISFGRQMTLQSAGDLAYAVTIYQLTDGAGKVQEKGNSVQIWKLKSDGKWQIVLDVMSQIPLEQK